MGCSLTCNAVGLVADPHPFPSLFFPRRGRDSCGCVCRGATHARTHVCTGVSAASTHANHWRARMHTDRERKRVCVEERKDSGRNVDMGGSESLPDKAGIVFSHPLMCLLKSTLQRLHLRIPVSHARMRTLATSSPPRGCEVCLFILVLVAILFVSPFLRCCGGCLVGRRWDMIFCCCWSRLPSFLLSLFLSLFLPLFWDSLTSPYATCPAGGLVLGIPLLLRVSSLSVWTVLPSAFGGCCVFVCVS